MDLSDAENQTLLEDLLSKLGGSTLQSDWQQQADAKTGAPYYWNAKVCATDSASCIPSLGAISRISSRLCLQTGETKWEKPVFEGAKQMTFEQLKVAINNHSFYKMQDGRHFVLLSLAEAESVRGNLHLSVSTGMPNSGAAQIALRMVRHCLVPANRRSALAARSLATDGRMLQVPADGVILDCSANYQQTKCVLAWGGLDRAAGAVFGFRTWPSSLLADGAHSPRRYSYQAMSAQQCFRFIDSEDHYEDRQLALLLRALQVNSMEVRQSFFLDIRSCRRRHQKNVWQVCAARWYCRLRRSIRIYSAPLYELVWTSLLGITFVQLLCRPQWPRSSRHPMSITYFTSVHCSPGFGLQCVPKDFMNWMFSV